MSRERRKNKAARKLRNKKRNAEQRQTDLDESREWYVGRWCSDAAHFGSHNYYSWMAAFLDSCGTILEIGTGDGSGTAALCKLGAVVVSVEENPFCLQVAKRKLEVIGIANDTELRPARERPKSCLPKSGALLIEGDIAFDSELEGWLMAIEPFDAVACWNIGTHEVKWKEVGDLERYRLTVQNRVYELADSILRPGGALHIIDRTTIPWSTRHTTDFISRHQEQASVTSLRVEEDSVGHMRYEPLQDGTGIMMAMKNPTAEAIGRIEPAFISIISRKPALGA